MHGRSCRFYPGAVSVPHRPSNHRRARFTAGHHQGPADHRRIVKTAWQQHLDGYNFLPFFQGKEDKSPRHENFYFDQGGNLNAVRYDDWKVNFAITEGAINTAYRKTPAWPKIVNLRADPFESAPPDSGMYVRWYADLLWIFVPIQGEVAKFAATLKEYPPVTGGSLSGGLSYPAVQIQQALDLLSSKPGGGTDTPTDLTLVPIGSSAESVELASIRSWRSCKSRKAFDTRPKLLFDHLRIITWRI